MATVEENITRIQNAKEAIRTSIIAKGVQVSEDELIGAYAAHIDAIETGGGGSEQFAGLIDRTATHIDIPEGTTKIGDYAFYNYTNLQSITIPDSVTTIGNMAFGYCNALTSINIPDSVTTIGNNTFYKCTGLTSITIPDSVTTIGNYAFQNCTGLTSVTIGSGVTSIVGSVLSGCSNLKSITCKSTTAPTVQSSTFGNSESTYTGRNSYNTGENVLKVPSGATGYNDSYWSSVLLDSTKCGFHIEYL